MIGRTPARALSACAAIAFVTAPVAGEEAKRNIRIEARATVPQDVRFDGGVSFQKSDGAFLASKTFARNAIVQDISLDFGSYQVPLKLLISRNRVEDIRFTVSSPAYAACDLDEVRSVAGAAPTGTIDQRVSLLIKAHRLIDLCNAYQYEVPKLTRAYYKFSCSLAGDPGSFFAIHRDATERFASLAQTREVARAFEDCKGRGLGEEVAALYQRARIAQRNGNFEEAAALTQELLEKVADKEWSDGFGAVKITKDHVQELELINLKAQQNRAFRQGQPAEALKYNGQLQEMILQPDYKEAFTKVGVNEALLTKEHDLFTAKLDMAQANATGE